MRKKQMMNVRFGDLIKTYDRVVLWQVMRTFNEGGKLLNGTKSMYVNIRTCVRTKESGNEFGTEVV